MKHCLRILLLSLLLAGCHRKMALQKAVTKDNSLTVSKTYDSSYTTTQTTEREFFDYGDTLRGSISLPLEEVNDAYWATDSIESDGIKTIATIARHGPMVKVQLTSIAKPKQVVNEKQSTITEQKQIATVDSVKKDLVITTKNKQVESKSSPFMFAALLFGLAIILLIIYIVGQYKRKW